MTRIEAIELKINEMQIAFMEEVKDMQKELAELKESKKEGKWKPAMSENYWFRNDYGDVDFCQWCDTDIDNWRYNNLPTFKTEEQCSKYWHFMDTVKEKSYEFTELEWKNDELFKFWIDCDCTTNTFHVLRAFVAKGVGTIYFKSPEDAQYIIDNFKDELMEYFV
jgi:hypothetical protein